MLRKTLLALGAVAAIGAAALTPSSASAHGWHHHGWHHGYGFGIGFYPAYASAGGNCYVVRRWVPTPFGYRPRRTVVCD